MAVSIESVPQERIAAVRRFNRFYTQRIGVLQGAWLDSPFSPTEARVLYELKQRSGTTEIGRDLGLDAGYLSPILRRFQAEQLIKKETSPAVRGRASAPPQPNGATDQPNMIIPWAVGEHRDEKAVSIDTCRRRE